MADDLFVRRRLLLKRWLATQEADYRQVALAAEYDPSYLRKLLTGRLPVSDSAAWRLSVRLGIPFQDLEPPAQWAKMPHAG